MFPSPACEIGQLSSFDPGRPYSRPRTILPPLLAAYKPPVAGRPHSAPVGDILGANPPKRAYSAPYKDPLREGGGGGEGGFQILADFYIELVVLF